MRALAAIIGVAALVAAGSSDAAAPPPTTVTPELLAAAQKEGKVVWYTSVDLKVAEQVAKDFESRHKGIDVVVERAGAERIFQRIGQEYGSGVHNADVINSSDSAHFIVWKGEGWLAPYVPEDVAKYYAPEQKDPDGMYATWRASLSVIGYNTKLVKPEEAPKSFADLLDPKWSGKIVKAHPGYSGTILTATFQIARDLGWGYLEKLAKQKVMQVQSSTEPPKKLALGERPVMADGNEYNMFVLKEKGEPVEVVYPKEGTPFIPGPSAVLKDAPRWDAARVFQSYLFTPPAQQLLIDVGGLRSMHPLVKEKPGRTPLKDIKLMKDDPAAVEKQIEEIKRKYTQYFHT